MSAFALAAESGPEVAMTGAPWTVDDLADLPDNGQRYEIIDGSLLVSPPPTGRHQGVAHLLTNVLNASGDPEWMAVQAIGVQLHRRSPPRFLIPDVVVARRSVVWSEQNEFLPSDVLLCVEIVSPSSVTTDRVTKPNMFAEAEIPAYWRVEFDADEKVSVARNRLKDGCYVEEDVAKAGEVRDVEWPTRCRLAPAELTGSRQS